MAQYSRTVGGGLMVITVLLVLVGLGLFTSGHIGWAQLFWVLASGTAGAGIVMLLERR